VKFGEEPFFAGLTTSDKNITIGLEDVLEPATTKEESMKLAASLAIAAAALAAAAPASAQFAKPEDATAGTCKACHDSFRSQ
jgi:cytochrome c556